MSYTLKFLRIFPLFILSFNLYADITDLIRLQKAYPESIHSVSENAIIWSDGSKMQAEDEQGEKSPQQKLENPSLLDQIRNIVYFPGIPPQTESYTANDDPGRIRYEPFFRKMYGDSEAEVETKLVTIYWMPLYFGTNYPLQVTTVNNVDQKLIKISAELEVLVEHHPEYLPYLENPGGTFKWRLIANTNRLSNHSFGMTIDINADLSDYWQWDLEHAGLPITEDSALTYHNHIPWQIIPIFEKYGFIWGGKWYHYDSMHFEYRPELMDKNVAVLISNRKLTAFN